ncbi:MAG: M50 family metallopeptidase [Candidatus Saccharibacteria bacterium]|nr:M50 family metallopeptidase [Candidatus Saccharibacteria bacterium]
MAIFLLVIGLLLFVSLVVIHEWGHFIAARRGGVEVEEFGIGFPPMAWSKKLKSGLLLSINWLPLGGFVKLKGENDSATSKGSFGAAPLKTKVKIMLAGVGMNLLTAFILLTFLALIGIPKILEGQYTVARDTKVIRNDVLIGNVSEDSPAGKAGLKLQDRIVEIAAANDVQKIANAEQLPEVTKKFAGKDVSITIVRNGTQQQVPAKLRTVSEVEASKNTDNPKGYLGISPQEYTIQRSTWSAPIVAAGLIKQFTEATLKGLGGLVANLFRGNGSEATKQVSGPVGIFVILKDGSLLGFEFILMIIAIISLTLAIMNALPIPALDGGRLFVTLLFRVMKKPLTKDMEEKIHGSGFAVLMLLFVIITIVDVKRFF